MVARLIKILTKNHYKYYSKFCYFEIKMLVEKKNKIFKFNNKNENLQVLAENWVK